MATQERSSFGATRSSASAQAVKLCCHYFLRVPMSGGSPYLHHEALACDLRFAHAEPACPRDERLSATTRAGVFGRERGLRSACGQLGWLGDSTKQAI